MQWKLKATIQNIVSLLPSSTSYAIYYFLQRKFGGLRYVNPVGELSKGIKAWKLILNAKYLPSDKVFFEVGTGRMALTPLAYWLMGARKTITIDLNPYLKAELVRESLQYISNNRDEIEQLFGSLLSQNRWLKLLEFFESSDFSISAYLKLCSIEYIAPSNATDTKLNSNSIDFHTSNNVFENIPIDILEKILIEGNRITRKDGLFIHDIDYSDHFSHSDKTISAINFLSYSDDKCKQYAGNKYMYMNRLRHDDFIALFKRLGHDILMTSDLIDKKSLPLLKSGAIQLDEQFATKSIETLSVSRSWIVSKYQDSQ